MCSVTEQCEWGCRWYCGNKIKQVCFKMLLLGLFLPNRLGSKKKRKRFHLKCIASTHPGAARADYPFTWHLNPCEDCDAFFFLWPILRKLWGVFLLFLFLFLFFFEKGRGDRSHCKWRSREMFQFMISQLSLLSLGIKISAGKKSTNSSYLLKRRRMGV